MLEKLVLNHVGPADRLAFDPVAPRVNLLTGDNGLGKTFLLDVAWWALTRNWPPPYQAMPHRAEGIKPTIEFAYGGITKPVSETAAFDFAAQEWKRNRERPADTGLVLYARSDGSFLLWDPARTRLATDHPLELHFSRHVHRDRGFNLDLDLDLDRAVQVQVEVQVQEARCTTEPPDLDCGPADQVQDARCTSGSLADGRDIPAAHVSSGMRRIQALTYPLVWAWQEHVKASTRLDAPVARQIVFLIDEVEAHLHPRWQRVVLRALINVMEVLTGNHDVPVQVLAFSHSPLLLASFEPIFDPDLDALWKLDLVEGRVVLAQEPWVRRGDASKWLTSTVFELGEATSLEAERALKEAKGLLLEESPDPEAVRKVDADLKAVLADLDPFLVRWRYFVEQVTRNAA